VRRLPVFANLRAPSGVTNGMSLSDRAPDDALRPVIVRHQATFDSQKLATELANLWRPDLGSNQVAAYCITGHGALGKTTICSHLENFGFAHLAIDRFALNRRERRSMGMSGYNPRSFSISQMLETLDLLTDGKPTFAPFYSHATGRTCDSKDCRAHRHWIGGSGNSIIVEGAFMWNPAIRERIAEAAFVDYECAQDYWNWRQNHDQCSRGYNADEALMHVRQLQLDTLLYINRSKPYCHSSVTVRLPDFLYSEVKAS
jgi:uridine kinase